MQVCIVDRCIRKIKGVDKSDDSVPFYIERTCPHKDTDCPERKNYKARMVLKDE